MVQNAPFAIRDFLRYSGCYDLSATVIFPGDEMLSQCYTLLKECSSETAQPDRQFAHADGSSGAFTGDTHSIEGARNHAR
jgi:hypothetical protein